MRFVLYGGVIVLVTIHALNFSAFTIGWLPILWCIALLQKNNSLKRKTLLVTLTLLFELLFVITFNLRMNYSDFNSDVGLFRFVDLFHATTLSTLAFYSLPRKEKDSQ